MYKGKRRYTLQQKNTINQVAKGKGVADQGLPLAKEPDVPIATTIDEVRKAMIQLLGNPPDLGLREFWFGPDRTVRCMSAFIDGVTDPVAVADDLISPLMSVPLLAEQGVQITRSNAFAVVKDQLASVWQLKTADKLGKAIAMMLAGTVLLFVEGSDECAIVGRRLTPSRDVTPPENQQVIRGPREAFTETIRTNTGLLRKRISHPSLRIERLNIGKLTSTIVDICWIEGLANDKYVQEARTRLQRIDIDGILDSGYIEELIDDQPWSPFLTVFNTERPDTLAAALLEGRVGILTDGSPQALIVPTSFVMFFQSAEDYYVRFHLTILLRLIRLISILASLILPPFWIAVVTFHQDILPTQLLMAVTSIRDTLPFPAVLEALFMVFTFEILREAGVRLPSVIGQAVSIVGALVIGQGVVSAGVVGPVMVVIIALTEIASFALPLYDMGATLRLLRYPLILLSGALGLFGLVIGLLAIIIHLCALRSFGVPYLSPVGPQMKRAITDTFIRAPWPQMKWRPRLTGTIHAERQSSKSGPQRPKGKGRE